MRSIPRIQSPVTTMLTFRTLPWLPIARHRLYAVAVVMFITVCLLTMVCCRELDSRFSYSELVTNDVTKLKRQMAIDPYTYHKLPVLKMLKRQVRHFRTDLRVNATVTLVFHVKRPFDIHWFNVETEGQDEMLYPILEGHEYYMRRGFRSGDVVAETLVVPPALQDKRHVLETVVTISRAPMMQYQLRTTLDMSIPYRLDNVESPEWLVVPSFQQHVDGRARFQQHCRAFVRRAKAGNSLMLMHAPTALGLPQNALRPSFTSLVQTHDDGMENVGEESGSLILKGTLSRLSSYKDVLDVTAMQAPAQAGRQGFYLCALERQHEADTHLDKLYLLSHVTYGSQANLSALLPGRPRVELCTCATSPKTLDPANTLVLRQGQTACVKCRGFGFPAPHVSLTPQPLGSINTTYVSVAEAGVVETVLMLRDTPPSATGTYICRAHNGHGSRQLLLHISVVRATTF